MPEEDEDLPSYRTRRLNAFKKRLLIAVSSAVWLTSIIGVRTEYYFDGLPDEEVGPVTAVQSIAWLSGLSFLVVALWNIIRSAYRSGVPGISNNVPRTRDQIWIARINGIMVTALSLGMMIGGTFGPIFPMNTAWLVSAITVPLSAVMLYWTLSWCIWGWRTPTG